MGLFDKVCQSLRDYFESDEITDKLMKKEYFNSTAFSGVYPIMNKKYWKYSTLLLLMHLSVCLFHMVLIIRTVKVFYVLNFTLLTFITEIYLLIQFCLLFVIAFNIKRKELRVLHREMMGEFFNYGEDHSGILDLLRKEMWKEKKQLLSLPVMLSIVGGNCIIVGPILDGAYGNLGFNVSETSLFMDTPIPADYPFPTTHSLSFYGLSFLQFLTMLFIIASIGSGALVFINVLQYFVLHQKYLIYTIETVESRAETVFIKSYGSLLLNGLADIYEDKRFQRCYDVCLRRSFQHHQVLIRWFESLSDLLSLPLGIAYATGTVVIALSLLSVKTGTSLPGTAITSFMMCILEVCFMALISVLGQRVADLSEDLRMAMYNIKWYCCSSSTKLDMQIFQEMSLRPMQLTGFGLVKANLDTFSNVMNSAYSYYNLIMAV